MCGLFMPELNNNVCQLLINEAFDFLIEAVSDNLYDSIGKSNLAEIMRHIKYGELVEKHYLLSFLKSIEKTNSLSELPHLNKWIKEMIKNIH
jgi:hypothetical protein